MRLIWYMALKICRIRKRLNSWDSQPRVSLQLSALKLRTALFIVMQKQALADLSRELRIRKTGLPNYLKVLSISVSTTIYIQHLKLLVRKTKAYKLCRVS